MAIKYVVRKGTNPQEDGAEVFIGRFKMEERVGIARLAATISDQCSVTPSDVAGIISALLSQIKTALANSQIVRLGDFGSLRCEVKSKLTPTEEEFTKTNLNGVKVVFTPGKEFRTACKGAKFTSAGETLTSDSENSQDGE